jgi:hypothetical protein
MSRWIFLLVAALSLAACGTDEGWAPDNLWPFADSQPAAAPQRADDAHCRKVAHARAADAEANGFDDGTRDEIYSGTYADCVNWDRAHPPVAAN